MDNVYELVNVEIHEYCALNVESGEKSFSKRKSNPCVTGLYFKNEIIFLDCIVHHQALKYIMMAKNIRFAKICLFLLQKWENIDGFVYRNMAYPLNMRSPPI